MTTLLSLINDIKIAVKLTDVLRETHLKKDFRWMVMQLHPDRCDHPDAPEALRKLNKLREDYEQAKFFKDDSGHFEVNHCTVTFKGDETLLSKSFKNYESLKKHDSLSDLNFHRYLPVDMYFDADQLRATTMQRTLPLTNLTLPQHHVLWILSRMLEVTAWFAQIGYVHGGINPESVWLAPESHGVNIGSFYHLTAINSRLKTISAKYKDWYPNEIFKTKRAITTIDLELCKRTAVYLLGDKSGIGVSLKRTHHPALVDFLLNTHDDAYKCYDDYRKLLKKNFKRKFHRLDFEELVK